MHSKPAVPLIGFISLCPVIKTNYWPQSRRTYALPLARRAFHRLSDPVGYGRHNVTVAIEHPHEHSSTTRGY